MTVTIRNNKAESNLRTKIRAYRKRAAEIKAYLDKHPDEWGRFQSEFNQEINGVFRDLMIFEKGCLQNNDEGKIYKLKKFFIDHFRDDFVKGDYLKWSLDKPYGYAGDHKVIDDIYKNSPTTKGFERLYDNYFQMSAICNAVRNRKEDFKRIVFERIAKQKTGKIKIMDLASGPCRDVYEVLKDERLNGVDIEYNCYDSDSKSLEYAGKLLGHDPRVKFIHQNAVRIALKKDVTVEFPTDYDVIYSTGLFDYLDYRISVRLVSNLKRMMKNSGIMAIADVREKFSNPSIYFMEWVADWNLIYRDDDEFRQVFIDSGFHKNDIRIGYEQQGVIQYVIAGKA